MQLEFESNLKFFIHFNTIVKNNKSLCEPCASTAIHIYLLSRRRVHKSTIKSLQICQVTVKKRCGAGLKTKVVNCGIPDTNCSMMVSGLDMCITNVSVLQNESKANHFKVHV